MRKPSHATPSAPVLTLAVFEKGKRNLAYTVSGGDPAKLVKQMVDSGKVPVEEAKAIRPKARKALLGLIEQAIPGITDAQLDIGGRRVRVKMADAA